jgi:CRP-like cAMP-binding protein
MDELRSSSAPTPVERILRSSRLFGSLEPALVKAAAGGAVRTQLVRGDVLWRAGDPATHFTLICAGLVKIVRGTPDAGEAIVGLFGPRESIGDAAVLKRGRYPADAVTSSERAEVCRVDATPVLAAMGQRPEVARSMNQVLLEHTHALQEKIRIMSAGSVPRRLATLLLHLADRFGDELSDGSTLIPVSLSRAELASLIGARPETTIRTLSRWRKAGEVMPSSDGFVVPDRARLEREAAGDET